MPDYDQNLENLSIAISLPLVEDLLHVNDAASLQIEGHPCTAKLFGQHGDIKA